MADQCYDVWLPNSRGNYYSKENLDDWDFSWDDMAFEDFPLIFNYIKKVTKHKKYFYVGHSQGTASIMALLSEYIEWNKRIYAISLLAPVGFVRNEPILGPLAHILKPLADSVI